MRKILITGGAGFIGSHLAKELLSDGYDVDIIDNLSTGRRENLIPGANFFELDFTQPGALKNLSGHNYGAILHLGGQSSGEKSFEDPLYDFDANARSTLLLSEWALEQHVPCFLYASSMGIYGQPDRQPVPELTHAEPISYYGASKYAAEQILRVAGRRGLRTVSFRMFNVYGPGQDLTNLKQGMVSIYLSYLLRNEPLIVKGSLKRIRDFIYIDDVAAAWKLALKSEVSGVFNLASGQPTSVQALITEMLKACGLSAHHPVQESAGTAGDQFAMCADISAIQRALGWSPHISLTEGLRRTVAWARGITL